MPSGTFCDEFLVPGENYNNNIDQAPQKSDLFALLVTPNLVGDANYVQSTEYPAAQKANKESFRRRWWPPIIRSCKPSSPAFPNVSMLPTMYPLQCKGLGKYHPDTLATKKILDLLRSKLGNT